ncbi:MAG TPA: M14 family metallopeptidase [Thermoanaerobaculia bacterium]|nr:M14 family metallopeptidase [Thermoanaerobaculia bacterium]
MSRTLHHARKFEKVPMAALALALGGLATFAGSARGAAPPAAGLLAPLSGGETIELPPTDDKVPRPDAVLGYPVGSRFTHWERIESYFAALAAASPRVKAWEYGRTYEGRPLELVAVSSPENIARLEEIRLERLRLAEPAALAHAERERLVKGLPVVIWLAYGIHGNEASSAEAAMVVAYALAAGQGETAQLLEHAIVLIDPLSNPDGRERYVHGFEQRQGERPNDHRGAAEHWEPWPGGRQNHYLIDLNRDWAWATQQESRSRIAAYRSWEPQVYVDFHEMGPDSSYFFPPPADPIHPKIDRRVLNWLETFGRANAEAFDRHGWVYYKNENYDLFYPGYGDSYPSLHGAIGMTYEMAGGGRGGLAIAHPDGSVLTLADRIGRHVTSSLATVHTAARNAHRLLQDFVAARLKAANEPAKSYLWPADQQEARTLADLLTRHGVRVQQLAQAAEIEARPLRGGKEEKAHKFAAGTYAVSTAQPLGDLVQALMDLEAPMAASFLERQRQRFEQRREAEFYDITAWSLPLAFNLRVFIADGELPAARRPLGPAVGGIEGSGELGYLVAPQGLASYRLAAELRRRKILHRVALTGFADGATRYPSGTLFIPRHGNPRELPELLSGLLREQALAAQALSSSFQVTGISLGSNSMAAVRPARVGLLSGAGVDPTSFGFLWYLLDREVGLAHDRLEVSHLRGADLAELDVLVMPNGDYDESIGERARTAIDAWIKEGGELVAVGGDTIKWLQDHELTSVKPWKAPEADAESEGSFERVVAEHGITTPGAIVATRLQAQHPLALGVTAPPPVLVEGSTVLEPTGDPRRDVLVAAPQDPVIAGFAWPEAKQRLAGSLLAGVEQRGSGAVVLFAQDPTFRLFWRATTPLFLNAVMYGPTAGLARRN